MEGSSAKFSARFSRARARRFWRERERARASVPTETSSSSHLILVHSLLQKQINPGTYIQAIYHLHRVILLRDVQPCTAVIVLPIYYNTRGCCREREIYNIHKETSIYIRRIKGEADVGRQPRFAGENKRPAASVSARLHAAMWRPRDPQCYCYNILLILRFL